MARGLALLLVVAGAWLALACAFVPASPAQAALRRASGSCALCGCRATVGAPPAITRRCGVGALCMADAEGEKKEGGLPFWLDPSTRGGAVVVPLVSVLLPIIGYFVLTAQGVDGLKAGNYVTVAYIVLGMVGWAGTYFFRVATKNMTYAQQLRDYEQAVIQKRFEELQEDEVEALLEELDEDEGADKVSFD